MFSREFLMLSRKLSSGKFQLDWGAPGVGGGMRFTYELGASSMSGEAPVLGLKLRSFAVNRNGLTAEAELEMLGWILGGILRVLGESPLSRKVVERFGDPHTDPAVIEDVQSYFGASVWQKMLTGE
jgi:hypothetical protein